MPYLFHQIMIFITTIIYIPLILIQIICTIKAINWKYRLLHIIAILCLIGSLPDILMSYQQYIMGHFSGLSETIPKMTTITDIIAFILILLIVVTCITGNIMIKESDNNIRLLKNRIKELKRKQPIWDKKLN